jgi:hypothetical protein
MPSGGSAAADPEPAVLEAVAAVVPGKPVAPAVVKADRKGNTLKSTGLGRMLNDSDW